MSFIHLNPSDSFTKKKISFTELKLLKKVNTSLLNFLVIKTIDQEISAGSQIEKKNIYENEQIILEKIKLIEEKYKEKNQEQILSILVSGLNQQMQYENKINSQNQTNEEKEQYEDIYDI